MGKFFYRFCDSCIEVYVLPLLVLALLLVASTFADTSRSQQKAHLRAEDVQIWKRNAELINGLIGMDLDRLSAMGKRNNAKQFVDVVDFDRFNSMDKRGNAELVNGLIGMDLTRLSTMGRRKRRSIESARHTYTQD